MIGVLLTPADVAKHLGLSTEEALDVVRRVPGAVQISTHRSERAWRLPPALLGSHHMALALVESIERVLGVREGATDYHGDPVEMRALETELHRKRGSTGPVTYVVETIGPPHLVKIGRANDLSRRLRGLCAVSPVPLRCVASFTDPRLELVMHSFFRHHWSHAEWFDAKPVLAFLGDCGIVDRDPSTRDLIERGYRYLRDHGHGPEAEALDSLRGLTHCLPPTRKDFAETTEQTDSPDKP